MVGTGSVVCGWVWCNWQHGGFWYRCSWFESRYPSFEDLRTAGVFSLLRSTSAGDRGRVATPSQATNNEAWTRRRWVLRNLGSSPPCADGPTGPSRDRKSVV